MLKKLSKYFICSSKKESVTPIENVIKDIEKCDKTYEDMIENIIKDIEKCNKTYEDMINKTYEDMINKFRQECKNALKRKQKIINPNNSKAKSCNITEEELAKQLGYISDFDFDFEDEDEDIPDYLYSNSIDFKNMTEEQLLEQLDEELDQISDDEEIPDYLYPKRIDYHV